MVFRVAATALVVVGITSSLSFRPAEAFDAPPRKGRRGPLPVDVRPAIDQEARDLDVASVGRSGEGRPPRAGIRISAGVHEESGCVDHAG